MTLLQILEACDNFSLLTASEKLTYFCLRADSKTPLGYLFPEVVELLQTYNGTHDRPPFEISEHRITFSPHVDDFESRSSVMKHLCETWRDAGNFSNVIGGKLWRGETFAIYEEPFREIRKDRAVFVMERVCCEIFGFVAYGVHMTMYTPDMRIWVPRRAKTKQTWPGYLDNSVAGGLPYGLTPREGLVKECMEEARTSQGYLEPEVQYIYDLCLPAAHPHGSDSDQAFIPQPLDGEVESFELSVSGRRHLSSRASKILSALEIPTESNATVSGVYDGTWGGSGEALVSRCPSTGEVLAKVSTATPQELHEAIAKSRDAYTSFRFMPAPRRGELVRQIREALAEKRDILGALVSLEMGKIYTEGTGEVQEFIDICDYAVGLSRMMNGRVISSERPGHTIYEIPNPLGVLGVLSAFNFPVAVYGWNLSLSMAAGNATLWKPAPSTPLCAVAVTKIVSKVLEKNGIPGAIAGLVCGGKGVGEAVVGSADVDMVSFTGSEAVGKIVGKAVQDRFGKVLLELGGNNAVIVMPDADLSLALPSVLFSSVGTAGQRCTSTRRLYLHRSIADEFLDKLQRAYKTIRMGDPLVSNTLLGPLHNQGAMNTYTSAVKRIRENGGEVLFGGQTASEAGGAGLSSDLANGNFVLPTIAVPKSASTEQDIWRTETFAPVLNVARFDDVEEAIKWNNAVPQGLSSSLWTRDIRNVGKWLGPGGSDAGIVNVNVGTSGAEIGAAFGGNKSTGWGRESGGDSWKQYVRWSSCTINFSDEAPLAQGVNFDTT
ncbi:hypothetical protein FRB98_005410 [Tulasnella sp. 332]|nr:hypothetical protein FRB98_005410 [Tulasnella sp. 332]